MKLMFFSGILRNMKNYISIPVLTLFGVLHLGCAQEPVENDDLSRSSLVLSETHSLVLQNEVSPSPLSREMLRRSPRPPAVDLGKTFTQLDGFTDRAFALADAPKETLAPAMKLFVETLDALALEVHLAEAEKILATAERAYRIGSSASAVASTPENKGLWIEWSDQVLLTKSALQRFFSEILVNALEKKLNSPAPEFSSADITKLSSLLHTEHERRIISQLRLRSLTPELEGILIRLIASSGGPLARLFIYQKFVSQPNLTLANALAQAGLPRVRDLLRYDARVAPVFPVSRIPAPFEMTASRLGGFSSVDREWKDLRESFEYIKQIPIKYAEANAKWLDFHRQVSELIDTLPASDDVRTTLKTDILQSYLRRVPRSELTYTRAGVEFQEGDIILLQSGSTGGLWETLTQSPSLLSHLMMVTFSDEGLPYAVEMNFGRLLISPLDIPADRFTVLRAKGLGAAERSALQKTIWKMLDEDLAYDFDFDAETGQALYCSELAAEVFKRAQLPQRPFPFPAASWQATEILKFAGSSSQIFYGQGSYLASKDFALVADKIQSDPFELIRGSLVLEAFRQSVADAKKVRLDKHAQAHKFLGLSILAHTLDSDLRRAIGPQPFLRTVMTLDDLLRNLDSDVRTSWFPMGSNPSNQESPIRALKNTTAKSLARALPARMQRVFPK